MNHTELIQHGVILDERAENQRIYQALNWHCGCDLFPDQILGENASLSYFACLTEEGYILPLQFVKLGHSRAISRQWCWFGKKAPWNVLAWAVIS